jgi:hypothetical protein
MTQAEIEVIKQHLDSVTSKVIEPFTQRLKERKKEVRLGELYGKGFYTIKRKS